MKTCIKYFSFVITAKEKEREHTIMCEVRTCYTPKKRVKWWLECWEREGKEAEEGMWRWLLNGKSKKRATRPNNGKWKVAVFKWSSLIWLTQQIELQRTKNAYRRIAHKTLSIVQLAVLLPPSFFCTQFYMLLLTFIFWFSCFSHRRV